MATPKILYRSKTNKMVSGIFGGLGEYFNLDATLLRLVFLLVVVCSGIFPGVILYIFAAFVVPEKPSSK